MIPFRLVVAGLSFVAVACASPSEEQVTYCAVEPIFAQRCLTCHDDPLANGAPIYLNSYERVYDARSRISWWVGDGRMPPVGDPAVKGNELPDDERELILQWVDDGAKDCN